MPRNSFRRELSALLCLALAFALDTQFVAASPLADPSSDYVGVDVSRPESKAVHAPQDVERLRPAASGNAKFSSAVRPVRNLRVPTGRIERILEVETAHERNTLADLPIGRSPPTEVF